MQLRKLLNLVDGVEIVHSEAPVKGVYDIPKFIVVI